MFVCLLALVIVGAVYMQVQDHKPNPLKSLGGRKPGPRFRGTSPPGVLGEGLLEGRRAGGGLGRGARAHADTASSRPAPRRGGSGRPPRAPPLLPAAVRPRSPFPGSDSAELSPPRPGPLHLPPAAASSRSRSRSPEPAEPPTAPRPLTHFVGQPVRHAAGHRGRRKRRQQRPPARFKQRRRRRVGARGGAAPAPVRRGSGPRGLCLSPRVAPSPGPGARW